MFLLNKIIFNDFFDFVEIENKKVEQILGKTLRLPSFEVDHRKSESAIYREKK